MFRPTAFTTRSQTGTETATRTPHRFALRSYAVAFQSLDGLGRAPSKHRKAVEVELIGPRETQRVERAETRLTRPQTVRLPSTNQEPCRSALRRYRNGEDPRHFPSAVSLRRPFASACPPCRSTLMLRTHTIRVTLRLRQCAAIAVCRLPPSKTPASSAQPAIAASDALAQPQEGHAQANAAGVRPSPVAAADGVAGFGSGLPGIPARQPLLSRRRRNVTPKVSPRPPSRARCSASPSRKAGLSPQSTLRQRPLDAPRRRVAPAAPRHYVPPCGVRSAHLFTR